MTDQHNQSTHRCRTCGKAATDDDLVYNCGNCGGASFEKIETRGPGIVDRFLQWLAGDERSERR